MHSTTVLKMGHSALVRQHRVVLTGPFFVAQIFRISVLLVFAFVLGDCLHPPLTCDRHYPSRPPLQVPSQLQLFPRRDKLYWTEVHPRRLSPCLPGASFSRRCFNKSPSQARIQDGLRGPRATEISSSLVVSNFKLSPQHPKYVECMIVKGLLQDFGHGKPRPRKLWVQLGWSLTFN